MSQWHESDEFWEQARSSMFTPEAREVAREQIEQLLQFLELEPPARVLDLGCGPGRHTIPLAERGFQVTGVDRTVAYLESVRERAEADDLDVELVEADMRKFKRPGEFDLAINLLTSFGYFDDIDEDRRVFENVHESLKPGGVLVVDTMGKEILASIFQERDWKEVDGEFWLYERRPIEGWRRMQNRWIRLKDGERSEFNLTHRLFSGTELVDLLRGAGFESVEARGSFDGMPYDQNAIRLVAIARKAE